MSKIRINRPAHAPEHMNKAGAEALALRIYKHWEGRAKVWVERISEDPEGKRHLYVVRSNIVNGTA